MWLCSRAVFVPALEQLLLFLSIDVIARNWRAQPAVRDDADELRARFDRQRQQVWEGFLRMRARTHEEQLRQLCVRLSALPHDASDVESAVSRPQSSSAAFDPFMSDDVIGLQRERAASRSAAAQRRESSAVGPRARVRWWREHRGAEKDGARVDSIWKAVFVPLADDVSASLETAFSRGHAACPIDEQSYVDLTSMWNAARANVLSGEEAEEEADEAEELDIVDEEVPMNLWLRSNPPAVSHFGHATGGLEPSSLPAVAPRRVPERPVRVRRLRRHDEAGTYWATARPRRFVQRSVLGGAAGAATSAAAPSAASSVAASEPSAAFAGPSAPSWFRNLVNW
jgi:hypothetical protein